MDISNIIRKAIGILLFGFGTWRLVSHLSYVFSYGWRNTNGTLGVLILVIDALLLLLGAFLFFKKNKQ